MVDNNGPLISKGGLWDLRKVESEEAGIGVPMRNVYLRIFI